ncbi:hypothetical protein GLOIN_2v1548926 [Rhizophagus irregularis DAOM 181602=DAOM 197198]|uniref:Uncharacterized protein n=1 Tax=Rhizophagus irregularis (strain DAOM 181602 / DAOM 197198 / MUCL 43194) TaxID=747089 RepID=A0A2P4QHZ4_RHIID|nr:hypothetical protein GLOIN_2v1548926 [Rhizophagus irregularis DAOM 181602=DAOM 197198]POG77252.1 hypothetical protein GLOIN_2v1548926 [Rhizophagus irregularis DAOM 181602=DAOM 197198]|eukprot:XP_025184118.1 hypothetical protein GLOIN_2v1548926 [Rhizophagus irregularis DAOM 181602=DAOM 197198]
MNNFLFMSKFSGRSFLICINRLRILNNVLTIFCKLIYYSTSLQVILNDCIM